MEEPFCYVAMPLGIKPDPGSGATIDFDRIFTTLIRPAVEEAGLPCIRADDLHLPASSIIQAEIFRAISGSVVMIGDLTTLNPNVLYEVGIRHGLVPMGTVLMRSWSTPLPFNLSMVMTVGYPLEHGSIPESHLSETRAALTRAVQLVRSETRLTSPVFSLVPEIEQAVPDVKRRTEKLRAAWQPNFRVLMRSPGKPSAHLLVEQLKNKNSINELSQQLKIVESQAQSLANEAPELIPNILESYRYASDWEGLIRFAYQLEPERRQSKMVAQELALALGRLNHVDQAIDVMLRLKEQHPDDPEVLVILGWSYRQRYFTEGNAEDLDQAISAYQQAFELNPTDWHTGMQALTLLSQRRDNSAQSELSDLLPRVKQALETGNQGYPEHAWNFWDVATNLELSILAKNWEGAMNSAKIAASKATAQWQMEMVGSEVSQLASNLTAEESREMETVREVLQGTAHG